LLSMTKDWIRNEYTVVPVKTIIAVVGAILYFINPFDLVPDIIPVLGFADDAAFVAFVIKAIKDDLDTYLMWKGNKGLQEKNLELE